MAIAVEDLLKDSINRSWLDDDSQDNALATATKAAPGANSRHVVTKVEASFSNAATSQLLTFKINGVATARKYIHGAGAMDLGDPGIIAGPNQAVSAELAASGSAGIIGVVVLGGYTIDDPQ